MNNLFICRVCGCEFKARDTGKPNKTCSRMCSDKSKRGVTQSRDSIEKRKASTAAYWANNPEKLEQRKANAAAGLRKKMEDPEYARLVSERSRNLINERRKDPAFVIKQQEYLEKYREKAKAAAVIRRSWECPICGKSFVASRAQAKGYCSRQCQDVRTAEARRGTKNSIETRAKKSQASLAWRLEHPDWEEKRIKAAQKATQTDEYRTGAFERYARMLETETGICAPEIRLATAYRAKWIMKKAQEELHCNTDFNVLFADVQYQLRLEMPYDGPLGCADYFDYCRKLGVAVTRDPRIRALADSFMSEALSRLSAQWKTERAA